MCEYVVQCAWDGFDIGRRTVVGGEKVGCLVILYRLYRLSHRWVSRWLGEMVVR